MEDTHNTEWALLFPLKAGLFAMKSSSSTEIKKKYPDYPEPTRLCIRRGSSMSEIDKLSASQLPDLVRSTTANQHLSSFRSPAGSLPHSPYLSRSFLSNDNTPSIRGSIGDLMNQKKYGSSQWSVRSETLIAKTVPLSTVTPKTPSSLKSLNGSVVFDEVNVLYGEGPLTAAQRTRRLAWLIKQQRCGKLRKMAHGFSVRKY